MFIPKYSVRLSGLYYPRIQLNPAIAVNRFSFKSYSSDCSQNLKDRTVQKQSGIGFACALLVLGALAIGAYLKKSVDEEKLIELAVKNESLLLLSFVSKARQVDELFCVVGNGEFEHAKFLIDFGGIDVNVKKTYKIIGADDEVLSLLDTFYPKSEKDVLELINFTWFIVEKGYDLNTTNANGNNRIHEIYNRHIMWDDTSMRRKLIKTYLKLGVSPLSESEYLGTPLNQAFRHGDGEFFVKTCRVLGIPIGFGSADEIYHLISATYHRGHVDDLKFLINQISIPLDSRLKDGCSLKDKITDMAKADGFFISEYKKTVLLETIS